MTMERWLALAATIGVLGLAAGSAAGAQTIEDTWATVAVPTPPPLKPVAAAPKTTALLVLDMLTSNCGAAHPRCVATVPHVAALVAAARAKGVLVIYSASPPHTVADTVTPLAATANDPAIVGHADKFAGTDLDATLKAKGITTVVVTGSSAHAAVLYTASTAALRGYNVVVPIDCMSSDLAYSEQYTTIQLAIAPTIAAKVTLTSSPLVSFAP